MSERRRDWLRVAILGGASMAGGPLIVAIALSFPLWASSIGAAMDWGTVFVGVFFQFAVFALPAGLLGILLGSWRVLYGRLKLWFLTIASVLTFSGWVGLLSIVSDAEFYDGVSPWAALVPFSIVILVCYVMARLTLFEADLARENKAGETV